MWKYQILSRDGNRVEMTAASRPEGPLAGVGRARAFRKEVKMLSDRDAIATIAVRDIHAAKKFYEGKLGLKPARSSEPSVLSYKSGNSSILVYPSQFAGTNKATAATWAVGDVDGTVRDLKSKGVAFEHYDLPDTAREGDVHVSGNTRVAWFKDPDGNILSIVNG
jgi:catechol 2,3-dioxygenase-like lactoylglutathione lyase family enzyme